MDQFYKILLIVAVSTLFVGIITPIIKKIAIFVGAMDIPNERKVHKEPMPRLGGLAIFFSFLLGYMLFAHSSVQMLSILIGGFIIVLTGLCDDIKPLRARTKFLMQIIASWRSSAYRTHIAL